MVPLGLGRPPEPRPRGGHRGQPARGRERWPPGGSASAFESVLRAIAATRLVVGRRGRHVPARGAPREADTDRRRSRRREQRRGGGDRRRARGVGRRSLQDDARIAAAIAVGSDVPFFLAGGPALVEGRGERVTPLRSFAGRAARDPARDPRASRFPRGRLRRPRPRTRLPRLRAMPATRLTSEHLVTELSPGYHADARRRTWCGGRASSPSPTTSLRPRTCSRPGLRALRRALTRLLGTSDRAVRLRPDPVGALSFARRGRGGGRRVRDELAAGRSRPRAGAAVRRRDDHRADRPSDAAHDSSSRQHHLGAGGRPARTARRSRPTTSSSAPARSAAIPATGELRRGRRRGPDRAGPAQPRGRARRRGLHVRRRRQDDLLPRRHQRLRDLQRGLRPVHDRPAAGTLHVRRSQRCRRARGSRSRRSHCVPPRFDASSRSPPRMPA